MVFYFITFVVRFVHLIHAPGPRGRVVPRERHLHYPLHTQKIVLLFSLRMPYFIILSRFKRPSQKINCSAFPSGVLPPVWEGGLPVHD